MRTILRVTICLLAAMTPLFAQQGTTTKTPAAKPAAIKAPPKVATSPAAKAALQAAKELAGKVKGTSGPEHAAALEAAAKAYDQVATDFANETQVAGRARFEAGDLWRRHDSLALAEQDFLQAAEIDAVHFGQRGLLGAADMQRRQKQLDKALDTYAKTVAAEPATSRAQEARLWQGRVLQSLGRMGDAIAAFQTALEAAARPRQVIEASDYLAKAQIKNGDYEAAAKAIQHAESVIAEADAADPVEVERLRKALEGMGARKALQRARDKQQKPAGDAGELEEGGGK